MDFAASFKAALEPLWQELRTQSSVISRLSEEVATLRVSEEPGKSVSKSFRSPVPRPPEPQDKKPLVRVSLLSAKRLIEVRTARAAGKVEIPTRKSLVKKVDDGKKKPPLRKSLTEKKLIVKTVVLEDLRDDRVVETEPVKEELQPVDISEQQETLENKEKEASREVIPQPSVPLDPIEQFPDFGTDPRFSSIDQALQDLREVRIPQTYGEQVLVAVPFALSLGARNALGLLPSLDDAQLYRELAPTREEVYWVLKVFFQLTGETLADQETIITKWRSLLPNTSEVESKVVEAIAAFNFSNENIDLLEAAVAGKAITPISPSLCALSSLLMISVKEALIHAGLAEEKVQPWRRFQKLLHRRRQGRVS